MGDLYVFGLPIGAIILGSIAYFAARRDSRDFDRRYGADGQEASDLFNRSSRHAK